MSPPTDVVIYFYALLALVQFYLVKTVYNSNPTAVIPNALSWAPNAAVDVTHVMAALTPVNVDHFIE